MRGRPECGTRAYEEFRLAGCSNPKILVTARQEASDILVGMTDETSHLETGRRVAAMIYGAMMGSVLLYAVAVEVVNFSLAPFSGFAARTMDPMVRYSLWGVALLQIILIALVRRSLLAKSAGPASAPVASVAKLITVAIVTAALAEIPAILGLVLFMVSGLRADFYGLLTLSLALLATWFPRLESWREWAAEPPASG